MTKPSKEEITKVIDEFMGYCDGNENISGCPTCGYDAFWSGHYTDSLDSLIPVWEKLGGHACELRLGLFHKKPFAQILPVYEKIREIENGKTLQEAAALATYYAIKELGK